ncbi:MAG: sigma-70 family RNA polymerase sigma factor, partial [Alphaproteobacteria bacterium]
MRTPLPANISKALKRIPRLSATEERDLVLQFRRGDKWARERLVLSQLRFVISIARRYRRHGCPLPDLIQEGTVGLLEAVKRFNPDHGTRLSTFAMWWIRSAMQDYVLRSGSIVRTVTTPKSRSMYFSPSVRGLDPQNEKAVKAVAERFQTTIDDVRSFANRLRTPDQVIDTSEDGNPLTHSLTGTDPDPELALATKQERLTLVRLLRAAMPGMTRRERHILRRRFLGEKRASRNKIGKELGLS